VKDKKQLFSEHTSAANPVAPDATLASWATHLQDMIMQWERSSALHFLLSWSFLIIHA